MNGDATGDRAAGYALAIVTGCASAYNLLLPLIEEETLCGQTFPLLLCCAVVLFFPCFFRRVEKFAWAGIPLLFLFGVTQSADGDFLAAMDFLFHHPGPAMVRFIGSEQAIPAVGGILAVAAFLCGKKRLTCVLFWAVNILLPGMLTLMGYTASVPALLAVTGCSALLFVRAGVEDAAKGKPGSGKAVLRTTMLAAAVTAAALFGSQAAFTQLQVTFHNKPKINFSEILESLHKSVYTTSGFHQYDPNYTLGRKMALNDAPVMSVRTNGPVYLRGRIYDTYNGRSWLVGEAVVNHWSDQAQSDITESSAFNYQKVLMYYYRTVCGRKGVKFSDVSLADSPLRMCHMSITINSNGQKCLFLPSFYENSNITFQSSYPSTVPLEPVLKGQIYTVDYYVPNFQNIAYGLIEQKKPEAAFEAKMQDDAAQMQELYGSTDHITPRVAALAKKITQGKTDERQKAAAISAWLQENCTYTLSPPQPWLGQDFTDFFLFSSRQGYCEHFATAMTLLLRASGVPARYVEGYAVPSTAQSTSMNVYEVTNAQAHAWVEYYSSRYGFLTADPTPGSALPAASALLKIQSNSSESASAPSAAGKDSSAPFFKPQSSSTAPSSSSSSDASADKAGSNSAELLLSFLKAAGILVLLAGAAYGAKKAYRALWFTFVRRRGGKKMVMAFYRYFARVLFQLGFSVPPSGTPNELAAKVRGKIAFSPISFDRITQMYCDVRYGGRTLTADEEEEWAKFYRAFSAACREYRRSRRKNRK